MLKRALLTIALSSIVWGCTAFSRTQVVNPDAPVITDYYAAEVISLGATWRVYLHARDRNGDMRDIVCVLAQRGFGTYPASVTRLSEGHREEVAEFLTMTTPVNPNLWRDSFTLRVLVRDAEGNRSERLELPLRFGRGTEQETPEKWKRVADHNLGSIQVRIRSTFGRS